MAAAFFKPVMPITAFVTTLLDHLPQTETGAAIAEMAGTPQILGPDTGIGRLMAPAIGVHGNARHHEERQRCKQEAGAHSTLQSTLRFHKRSPQPVIPISK
jgi:hypothetical protein